MNPYRINATPVVEICKPLRCRLGFHKPFCFDYIACPYNPKYYYVCQLCGERWIKLINGLVFEKHYPQLFNDLYGSDLEL